MTRRMDILLLDIFLLDELFPSVPNDKDKKQNNLQQLCVNKTIEGKFSECTLVWTIDIKTIHSESTTITIYTIII